MKSKASTYGKGWNYVFRGQEGKEIAFVQFIEDVAEYELEYITENPDAGTELLEDNKDKASLDLLKKNAEEDLLESVNESEEALGANKTLELLLASVEMQPTGPGTVSNSLFNITIDEINFSLRDRPGRINQYRKKNRDVPDLFESLGEDIDLSDVDHIRTDFGEVFLDDNDKSNASMDIRNVHWNAVVDPEKFENELMYHLTGREEKKEKEVAV